MTRWRWGSLCSCLLPAHWSRDSFRRGGQQPSSPCRHCEPNDSPNRVAHEIFLTSVVLEGDHAPMRTFLNDLTYALRQMRKAPGFTLIAVITLALGIGANAAIFTLIHAILLRPLPVKNPSALYRLGSHNLECCVTTGYSGRMGRVLLRVVPAPPETESGIRGTGGACRPGLPNVSVRRDGRQWPGTPLHAEFVSGNYFSTARAVSRLCGTPARPSDDQAARLQLRS